MKMPNSNIVTQKDLIDLLYEDFGDQYTKREFKDFFSALEYYVWELLKSADEQHPVQIKLFNGLQLNSKFQPEKMNRVCGVDQDISARLKTTARLTRYYNRSLNDEWKNEQSTI